MASLKEIAQLAHEQIFSRSNDEAAISLEQFITTAKTQYAWEIWRMSKEEKRDEGVYNIPSVLLTPTTLKVDESGIADISNLNPLRSLTNDKWIVNMGGVLSCKYIASNINNMQLLDDDDSLGEDAKRYYVTANQIRFPDGVFKNPVEMIYANDGLSLDEKEYFIDDVIAAVLRTKLIDIYKNKGEEDLTNNSNSKDK